MKRSVLTSFHKKKGKNLYENQCTDVSTTLPPKKQQQLLRHRCTISGNAGGSGRISGIVLCNFFSGKSPEKMIFLRKKTTFRKDPESLRKQKKSPKKKLSGKPAEKVLFSGKNHFPESLCIFDYSFMIFFIFFLRKKNFLEFDSLIFIYSDYMRFHPYRGRQHTLFHKDLIGDVNTLGFIKTTYFLLGDLSAGMGPETLVSDPF